LFERYKGGTQVYTVLIGTDGFLPSSAATDEFMLLCQSAGAQIVGQILFKINKIHPKYFMGVGKITKIKEQMKDLAVQLVIIDELISASQQKNIEEFLECRVLDRAGLILDIFATRAKTYEGKLQVALAQLEYLSTRLIRGWTHLERQRGGIGLRGPGETQLESDRRIIRTKIKSIKSQLVKVKQQRKTAKTKRVKNQTPSIALVGYTNAGKSSLFKALTGKDILVEDKLFATLDPTVGKIIFKENIELVCIDTVGFISRLPHTLIEAFKTTLYETTKADLLLIVIDFSDKDKSNHLLQVKSILKEIQANDIPYVLVYNKIDKSYLKQKVVRQENQAVKVYISVQENKGIDMLKDIIKDFFAFNNSYATIKLEATQIAQKTYLYKNNFIKKISYSCDGSCIVDVQMPKNRWFNFKKTLKSYEKKHSQ
jgi:GTPase